jgi:hypothetical protein
MRVSPDNRFLSVMFSEASGHFQTSGAEEEVTKGIEQEGCEDEYVAWVGERHGARDGQANCV